MYVCYVIVSFISTPIQSIHSPHLIHNLIITFTVVCTSLFALCRTLHIHYISYTVLTFIFPATIWHQFRTRDYGNKNKNDYTLWK